ncbi:histidinol dehydrogenase [Commensalibacter papalotli (ex Botero et al. 2024)]|uniref:Histidinol dehydrogenase n=1 Tax=Commensalibacter papalotli (ex Botero et al. 2024) TaxID=2972766 RepID=A0ABM9HLU8_9PROT|nr:histidinol dehydrogenase [Commensalibacter papalotli (ex Botero et al. 2024)]CAI3935115.1 Histidinol dehydrogenase (HisD) (PDB:1K75) [Commensalibacter papalotli (ex Botero et al. 2024)]CAI3951247.1 Histidinol dehydrogenase (HisD) (PDB:1K75) [Commensalibacter papalotli (ex Botero et al. 2024)]
MQVLLTTQSDFQTIFNRLLATRAMDTSAVKQPVTEILENIRKNGDTALCDYTKRFDRLDITPQKLRITDEEIQAACKQIPVELMDALDIAAKRIKSFHEKQLPSNLHYEDESGFELGYRWLPMDSAGLYVPGGTAAYPSSVLMNAIPAKVAGVKRLAMCVPTPDGQLNPLVLAAAHKAGITEIYRIGGAQAVAALAYGTQTIAPVDYIVGPGNAYVAEAKRQVYGLVGIDSVAGPSEVVVVADKNNNPTHIALDLLAQSEHDKMAQSIFITNNQDFADQVIQAVNEQLAILARKEIAQSSWDQHGAVIIVQSWDEAATIVNQIAPEHLELMVEETNTLFEDVRHAGAIFIGKWCPEAIGDYVGGPNHVLPTSGAARFSSGLSIFDFMKRTTFLKSNEKGIQNVGPAAVAIANTEGLTAHALSISQRLKSLGK